MVDLSQSDDFHDSNLIGISLDVSTRALICRLDAYLSMGRSRVRTPITLTFSAVRGFSATADLKELRDHASAGNVEHWAPRNGFNLIRLAGGTITFEASRYDVAIEKQSDLSA